MPVLPMQKWLIALRGSISELSSFNSHQRHPALTPPSHSIDDRAFVLSKWNRKSQNRTLMPPLSLFPSLVLVILPVACPTPPPSFTRLLSVFPICYANGATERTTSSGKCDKYLIRHNGSCRGCLIVPHVIWREVRHGLWSRSLSF